MRWHFLSLLGLGIHLSEARPSQRLYKHSEEQAEKLDAIKEAFFFSWNGYREYAFPHDDLRPVSNGFADSRNAWGASAIDALTTALLMDLPDVVAEIVDYVPTIDFSTTNTGVSLFETTIRYLGGLISGYDLLKGPLSHLIEDKEKIEPLLEQAIKLADILKYAFDTPSGIPYNNLNITNKSTDGAKTNGLAVTGTLVLEWTRLSDLTGNQEYASLVQKAEQHLLNPLPKENEPWPGLVGGNIDIATGEFSDADGGWSGGTDSFYEYLIKMYIYDQSGFQLYKDRWVTAAESTIKYLASHPAPRPELTFVAQYNNKTLDLSQGHLTCFHGGNFIIGGEVLGRQDFIDFGLKLVDGCHETYIATATHIGPEVYSWDPNRVPENQRDFYNKNGFYITAPSYVLRPEVIESFYYAYRSTGDAKYQGWVWDAFVAINATTRANSGFSAISNVNQPGGGRLEDHQESFWFAETLKYIYLAHAPDAEWQILSEGVNKWVYNTEAHPVRVKGTPI